MLFAKFVHKLCRPISLFSIFAVQGSSMYPTTSVPVHPLSQLNSATVASKPHMLVVIDERVTDIATLQTALVNGCAATIISKDEANVIAAITAQLASTGATRLGIIAHGEPGVIHLGATPLTLETLNQQAGLLAEWGVEEIALYACEVGADQAFVAGLEQLTGAVVAAATGKVGAAALGGSWTLSGAISQPFALDRLVNYSGVLTTFTGTAGNDVANANNAPPLNPAVVTGFTGGTLAQLQDTTGDFINGLGGNDTIVGGTAADTMDGGDGNDSLQGGGGADLIFGGAGSDIINGFFGADTINGGNDVDALIFTTASSTTDFNTASDAQLVDVESIVSLFQVATAAVNINLSNQTENFFISVKNTDTLTGSLGIDTIVISPFLSVGSPIATFNPALDSQLEGVENIICIDNSGITNADIRSNINLSSQNEGFEITGSSFDDTIIGGSGGDIINGGAGNEGVRGGAGDDIITDNLGVDYLLGEAGNDSISGGADGDYLDGGADNDTIEGGDGNDTLLGATGDDIMDGGSGNDFFVAGDGIDSLTGGIGNDTILGGNENDTLLGGDGNDALGGETGNDNLFGEAGNDYMLGGEGNDSMHGGENVGNDILFGEGGDDYLAGGMDSDLLYGGAGNDTFVFGSASNPFYSIGVDNIFDFTQGSDKLVLDTATFTFLTQSGGNGGFGVSSEFASVTGSADTSNALIVYDNSSGGLFYNINGSAAGFGGGGQFAVIVGNPALTTSDFIIA
jgi:Ca2+-binding RTX toxin-like protein